MVYEWEGKEADSYRLYVEKRRSLDEVMEYWKLRGFTPSKRAFQTQFKRWDFPSKQNPAHKNPALVARVKELWETNTSQRDMLQILNDEGFELRERELMRVRAKNRWLLRVPNGMKGAPTMPPPQRMGSLSDALMTEVQNAVGQENSRTSAPPEASAPIDTASEQSPEVLRERQDRLEKRKQESEERWASKKRRRRTRNWAGLPPDPAQPPRYPSETTIDESKAYLDLDNEKYRELRDQFQAICSEEDVIKKRLAGPERWQGVKDRLIAENEHLSGVFARDHGGEEGDKRALSLDVICTDVTKRMRTMERRMTVAEAKNIIGVNPEESRVIRNNFYDILKAEHFTSKLEMGIEHWEKLKEQWISDCPILQRILSEGDADAQQAQKLKALEFLCRDVVKRLHDDLSRRNPSGKKLLNNGPGPGPAPPKPGQSIARGPASQNRGPSSAKPAPLGYAQAMNSTAGPPNAAELQIDPSLLLAASDLADQQDEEYSRQPSSEPEYMAAQPAQEFSYYAEPSPTPIPVYFRLHQHSLIQAEPRIWLGALTSGTMEELRDLSTRAHPGSSVVRIEGVVKGPDLKEVNYPIDDNEELGGYLAHMSSGKVTFAVQLA
ncbi:hypothetical protein IWX90DRAFT_487206 [Phyllosticta citrichinensis]|uniref:Clr5 domain-containing protein n=1 Tax=Phyllosticta citrichinensis TaxID=1130410 RepID=A0ABR1XQS5_9PEZI